MSKEKNIKTNELFKQDRFLGIFVHLLTGFGIVAGFFALISVMNNNQKEAFLWLGFAFLIDSVDGTLARKFNVKKNFPNQVNRDYFCDGESLSKDQVIELNNRLVIGLFHKAKSCNRSEIVKIDNHQVTGLFCKFRNNTPDEELQSGMGDIFIKLAR